MNYDWWEGSFSFREPQILWNRPAPSGGFTNGNHSQESTNTLVEEHDSYHRVSKYFLSQKQEMGDDEGKGFVEI